jgi:hypothetical protein
MMPTYIEFMNTLHWIGLTLLVCGILWVIFELTGYVVRCWRAHVEIQAHHARVLRMRLNAIARRREQGW